MFKILHMCALYKLFDTYTFLLEITNIADSAALWITLLLLLFLLLL